MTPGRADTGALSGQKVVHFVHLTRWAVARVMKMDGEKRHYCGEMVPGEGAFEGEEDSRRMG